MGQISVSIFLGTVYVPLGSAFGSEKSSGRKQQLMQTKRPETLRFRIFLARREGFEPPAFWSVGCLKHKSESFRLRFVLFTTVRRRIFHCFRPDLPAFFGFWVKTGSKFPHRQFSKRECHSPKYPNRGNVDRTVGVNIKVPCVLDDPPRDRLVLRFHLIREL